MTALMVVMKTSKLVIDAKIVNNTKSNVPYPEIVYRKQSFVTRLWIVVLVIKPTNRTFALVSTISRTYRVRNNFATAVIIYVTFFA